MTNLNTPESIKVALHNALSILGSFEQCALLDYPNHLNIGDNLIWLGEIFYLTDVAKTKITYVSTNKDFCPELLDRENGNSPILLHGGGNLGDLWSDYQKFREHIISKYHDRPIAILPQSIYFGNSDNLKFASKIFNSHPNLTIFVRDNYSFEIAQKHFYNCHIIKSPDMAFQMLGMPGLARNTKYQKNILYLNRQDKEISKSLDVGWEIPNLINEDWVSLNWLYRETTTNPPAWYWQIPGSVKFFRESWQKRLSNPQMWMSRILWQKSHPYSYKLKSIYNPEMHLKSWSLMHSGVFQFNQYKLIITNRLHGHILCLLLGIPHVFLANSYYKNEAFYQTWTLQIPWCRFVKEKSEIKQAIQEISSESI